MKRDVTKEKYKFDSFDKTVVWELLRGMGRV
jgi:hypothetical protein